MSLPHCVAPQQGHAVAFLRKAQDKQHRWLAAEVGQQLRLQSQRRVQEQAAGKLRNIRKTLEADLRSLHQAGGLPFGQAWSPKSSPRSWTFGRGLGLPRGEGSKKSGGRKPAVPVCGRASTAASSGGMARGKGLESQHVRREAAELAEHLLITCGSVREAFEHMDSWGTGRLTRHDWDRGLQALGCRGDASHIFTVLDRDHGGQLGLDDMLQLERCLQEFQGLPSPSHYYGGSGGAGRLEERERQQQRMQELRRELARSRDCVAGAASAQRARRGSFMLGGPWPLSPQADATLPTLASTLRNKVTD